VAGDLEDERRISGRVAGPTHGTDGCPFCHRIALGHDLLAESQVCVAIYDLTPLNPGHALVIPRRHEPDFLALSPVESSAIMRMVKVVRNRINRDFRPHGFNLGVNVGVAGGQTIDHAHLHLIPRYLGDIPDPKGGIRWLIPERARYWTDESQGVRP